jgi:hypothetical protein
MQPLSVPQIDFLPASYRQLASERRERVWRVATAIVTVVAICTASLARYLERRSAQSELGALVSGHERAEDLNAQWTDIRQREAKANAEARLATYVRHPWPTSRMLSAVVGPLPESIRLTELKIVQEAEDASSPPPAAAHPGAAKPDEVDKRLPVERDLEQLRAECNREHTVMQLTGEGADSESLHEYIGGLSRSNVVKSAELQSLQTTNVRGSEESARLVQFHARVVLRPGYGQPGGPSSPAKPVSQADQTQVARRAQP